MMKIQIHACIPLVLQLFLCCEIKVTQQESYGQQYSTLSHIYCYGAGLRKSISAAPQSFEVAPLVPW